MTDMNESVDNAIPPLEGHPLDDAGPVPLHPTHALVLEAHAAMKAKIETFERRGIHPSIDDVRLAFRALDAVLAEVDKS